MTDLFTTSANLKVEGDDLRSEIDRHAKAMYDRIDRQIQRHYVEITELEAMNRRFGWVAPPEAAANRGLESMAQRRLQTVQPKEKTNG